MLTWADFPYTLPLILCSSLMLALAAYAARHHELRGARAFMWLCLAAGEWAFTYALELASPDLPAKMFWARVEYLGIVSGPLCWLAFALSYTGREYRIPRRGWLALSLIPLTTLALVMTDETHGLVWRRVTLDASGPFPALHIEYGPWFAAHTASSYLCVLLGGLLLLTGLTDTPQIYRRQRLALLVAIVVPWVGNILYIVKLSPVPGLDLTPLAATVAAAAVALALFRFRLLDLVPVARRATLNSMRDGVIALDLQNRILDLNEAGARIIGVGPKAAIGRPAVQVLQQQSDLLEGLEGSAGAPAEIVRGPADGPRYYEVQTTPLRDVVGQEAGRLVTLHDITERKRAEQEIQTLNAELEARVLARTAELAAANQAKDETLRREQEARQDLAFLAEASRLLATSLDEATTLTSVTRHLVPYLADGCAIDLADDSGRFRRVTSTHRDPQKARLMADLAQRYPEEDQAPYGSPHVVASRTPELYPQVADADLAVIASDPAHLALLSALEVRSYICVPLLARGRTLGAITLIRSHPDVPFSPATLALAVDLAQRVALALDNARLYRAAQQAVHARDEFLTVASHELKTPLTSLLLAVHTTRRSTRPDGLPPVDYLLRRLGIIEEQSNRVAHLVNDLLDISRITAGRLQLEPRAMDLAVLVRQVVDQFQEELAAAHCALSLRADDSVPGNWDPARLEQVITNLLTNALKYGRGHPVSVAVGLDGEMARLTVADQGIGIAPEHQERIFGRFERAVAPGKYGGMGMGLYITRQIVEAHGGTIAVNSAEGAGATFTVVLPRGCE